MKTPPEKATAIQSPFDEWTKSLAYGLTRRKTLQLLGGGLSGALLALGLPKSWAAPSTGDKGCGHICATLFKIDQAAFESCTHACEDCKSCGGTPKLNGIWPQGFTCTATTTPCRSASGLVCCQTGTDCCLGNPPQVCYTPCNPDQVRDPSTCRCVSSPTNKLHCVCNAGFQEDLPCQMQSCEEFKTICDLGICSGSNGGMFSFTCTPCTPV
jgi:hypothetical protein